MRIFGFILLIFASLNLIVALILCIQEKQSEAQNYLHSFFTAIILDLYIARCFNKKNEEEEMKDKWRKGE